MPLQMVMKISKRQILTFKKPGGLGNSIAELKDRAVISNVKRKEKRGNKKMEKESKKIWSSFDTFDEGPDNEGLCNIELNGTIVVLKHSRFWNRSEFSLSKMVIWSGDSSITTEPIVTYSESSEVM